MKCVLSIKTKLLVLIHDNYYDTKIQSIEVEHICNKLAKKFKLHQILCETKMPVHMCVMVMKVCVKKYICEDEEFLYCTVNMVGYSFYFDKNSKF